MDEIWKVLSEVKEKARVMELSHLMEEGMPIPGDLSKYYHDLWSSYDLGDGCLAYQCVLNEHSGTHVDAPAHMLPAKTGRQIYIHENAADRYCFPCRVMTCRFKEGQDEISLEMIRKWEDEAGPVSSGEGVFFYTGWDVYWKIRDPEKRFITGWPGLSKAGAEYLAEKGIAAVGTDCLSIDSSSSAAPFAHRCLLSHNMPIFENLANLGRISGRCFILALPLLIKEGTASPVRVLALL